VAPGALLIATRSAFDGPINASGAAGLFLANNTVVGPLRVSGSAGVLVASNQVTGPVEVSNNGDDAALVLANTVVGPLRCAGNSTAPRNLGIANSVTGPKDGQ